MLNETLQKFRTNHPVQTLQIGDTGWEYIACGCGDQTLLLLNGGLRVAETAFPYILLLEDHYRLIVPTYPPLVRIDDLTDGIKTILDHEGAGKGLVLGQSFGGMVAQVMVARFPDRFTRMVLSSTGPITITLRQQFSLGMLLATTAILPGNTIKKLYRVSLTQILSVPDPDRDFWDDYLTALFETRLSKADVRSHFRTGADTQWKYRYSVQPPWSGPVLVIGGETDPISTEADRRAMLAHYPNAQLALIPEAGHSLAMEVPETYLSSITSFFE